MDRLYSALEVAEMFGVTKRRVIFLARREGVGRIVGKSFVFTRADIEAMRPRPHAGRPPLKDGKSRRKRRKIPVKPP